MQKRRSADADMDADWIPELQIRGGIEDNSKIIFIISQ